MSVLRLCSCLSIAIAIASIACTTFKGEDADPKDGGSSVGDSAATTDGGAFDADADAGPECRSPCTAPCVVDAFDGQDPAWTKRVDNGNSGQIANGFFRSHVAATGGAYLEQQFTPAKEARPLHLSFEIFVEVALSNGSSLAKFVDNVGNEVTIEMHDGKIATCVRPIANAPANPCADTDAGLAVGDRRRITLDASFPSTTKPGRVDLRVGCGQAATIALPATTVLNLGAPVSFHLGVESPGAVRYDDADVLLPK